MVESSRSIWFDTPPTRLPWAGTVGLTRHLGIELTEDGEDWLAARMPVDERTLQPFGLLHGGASVVLAETLASIGSAAVVDLARKRCVGLEINANHLRGVRSGWVTGIARPLHLGRTTHVWDIRIADAADRPICVSRCTVAVVDAPTAEAPTAGTPAAGKSAAGKPPTGTLEGDGAAAAPLYSPAPSP